jgi:hypothetical protein
MSVLRCDIEAGSAANYCRLGRERCLFVSAAANLHAFTKTRRRYRDDFRNCGVPVLQLSVCPHLYA